MLEESLTALTAAGGAAVVQAAGTDAWAGLRERIARLFGRGDGERERSELARLDRSAAELAQPDDAGESERVRFRQATVWQTRFEDLLEQSGAEEQEATAAELRTLLAESELGNQTPDDNGGVTAGRDISIRADRNSLAAGLAHIEGGVRLGNPPPPGSDQR